MILFLLLPFIYVSKHIKAFHICQGFVQAKSYHATVSSNRYCDMKFVIIYYFENTHMVIPYATFIK